MTNLGSSFKRARESKGLSLAKIAGETRISSRFLEAIENEEFHLLPGGIFNRGFIRTYAERVGLDPEAAVSEYEQLIKTQEPEQQIASTESPVTRGEKNFYPVAIGALVLAIVIFYIVTRDPGNRGQTAEPPATAATEPVAPEPAPTPSSALALDIECLEQTWIKVNADGANVSPGEILEPGMTRHFTAQTSLNLIVGNAGGLALKLNDQKMKPIGKNGQVREIVITPANLKDFIG
jgi:transcriptional regulator with XRE-family HTH domain